MSGKIADRRSGKPLILDLFCGAGGSSWGYKMAGFRVVGVDHKEQKNYPFEFYQWDALEFLQENKEWIEEEVSIIHASPPCQLYSRARAIHKKAHPDLVDPTREALIATGKPWIIENVPGAPLIDPVILCGSQFDRATQCRDRKWRQLRRHRLFESTFELHKPKECHHIGKPVGVYGKGGRKGKLKSYYSLYVGYQADRKDASKIMGIHWMSYVEMAQAVPPIYTRYLGRQMMEQLNGA